ncbi:MAG: asparagine synthase (glutamine-hydrolyzing) [Thermoproteota archaeon]|nr:asparagine synthase (glutamine-hydrolyzing) [Thermoproteota archaeon]
MCGICGIIGEPNKYLLKLMCNNLIHRGPDSEGYYIDDHVGLGVRRLRIIDLKTGDQPIHNEDETVWVVFNGEIYNFIELRNELKSRHKFYTNTDTEVLVHLWEEEKEKMLNRIIGMFAFAIYDSKEKTVFIARDRFGEKPLYYTFVNDNFIFASELRAIINCIENPEINPNAIASYLAFFYNHLEESFIKKVYRLNPASYILYSLKDKKATFNSYWDLNFEENNDIDLDTALKILDANLKGIVKNTLISDVPLGVLLSGGVDSSVIAKVASEYSRLKTMHVTGSEEEVKFAEEVVNLIKSDHKTIHVKTDFMKDFDQITIAIDEPVADPSIIPTFYICREIKKEVTVALTGEGGDEMFWGYPWININDILSKWFSLPKFIRKIIISLGSHLNKNLAGTFQDLKRYEKYRYYSLDNAGKRLLRLSHFNKEELKNIIVNSFEDPFIEYEKMLRKGDEHKSAAYVTIKKVLPNDFLHKDDRISMKNSLELRAPFLNHILMQKIFSFQNEMKINHGIDKYLLKVYAIKYLKIPKHIILRKKVGFSISLKKYHKDFINKIDELSYLMKELNLNYNEIKKYYEYYSSYEYTNRLFSIALLLNWFKLTFKHIFT